MTQVPETPEERRRRRTLYAIIAVVVVVVTAIAVGVFFSMRRQARIDAAVSAATKHADYPALLDALNLLKKEDAPDGKALWAHLGAMALLEHGYGDVAPVRAALKAEGVSGLTNAKIATVYLALADTQVQEAARLAAQLGAKDAGEAAEVAHAQSVVALAAGRASAAALAAQTAHRLRPEARRDTAVLALALARLGRHQEALDLMQASAEFEGSTLLRTVRARIQAGHGARALSPEIRARVRSDAEAVLGKLKSSASPAEQSWARLLLAEVEAVAGNEDKAREQALQAGQKPPISELYSLRMAGLWLALGDPKKAAEYLEREGAKGAAAPGYRAQLRAALALDQGALEKAEAALRSAPNDARTALLQGRLDEALGSVKRARAAYQTAEKSPQWFIEARTRRARMELEHGQPGAAEELIAPVLKQAPGDSRAVPVAVGAKLARDGAKEAMAVVKKALALRPDHPALLGAKARIEIAMERWEDARATLRKAMRGDAGADLHAYLGEAEHGLGNLEAATSAYQAALAKDPKHPSALAGLLQIAVERRDREAARAAFERLEAEKIATLDAERARAAYWVLTGDGRPATNRIRLALRRHPRDAVLWLLRGHLHCQADEYGPAIAAYRNVPEESALYPLALLGVAQAQIGVAAQSSSIDGTLRDAIDAAKERNLQADFSATLQATRSLLRLDGKRYGAAMQLAASALRQNEAASLAHLVRARVRIKQNRDPSSELRAALQGDAALPEAKALLAEQLAKDESPEACELAAEYLRAVPRGRYTTTMRRVRTACR